MQLSFVVCFLFVITPILAGPIIETPLGRYEGWERLSRSGRTYQAWTKIPYAKPPVGNLRFKAPLPIGRHDGLMNTTAHITQCIQPSGGVEDCLYLNVFRPKVVYDKLAVLVYVHGGAFLSGDPGVRETADYLMDEDIVLVQIAYRLNGFGFLSLGDKVLPGNYGLKDQAMALAWVNQNIASFGGDPKSVTVFGGSAGGASTHYLLKSPLTENLVARAVSHSGSINHVWAIVKSEEARQAAMGLVGKVKCARQTSEEILECLQKLNSTVLEAAIFQSASPNGISLVFAPVIEPKDAENAFATEDLALRPSKKPWVTTFSNGEFQLLLASIKLLPPATLSYIESNIVNYLGTFIGSHTNCTTQIKEGAQILQNLYFSETNDNFSIEYSKMFMDNSFVYPALFNLWLHEGPKWLFRMEYKGELSSRDKFTGMQSVFPVAGHDDERLYYFNTRSEFITPLIKPHITPEDLAVSKRLIQYLVNFAKYGDPTPPGTGFKWPQFRKNEMIRVTANGDIPSRLIDSAKKALDVWSYVIGWK